MSKLADLLQNTSNQEDKEQLLMQGIRAVLKEEHKKELENKLSEEYNVAKQRPKETKIRRLFPKIAAVAAVILLLFFFVRPDFGIENDSHSLAEQYVNEDQTLHPGVSKGITNESTTLQSSAIQQFNSGDFVSAAQSFSQLADVNDENKFYMALSQLKSGQHEQALQSFQEMDELDTVFDEEINWYLSLAYALNDDTGKALEQLREIKKDDWKFTEAQRLIRLIE